MKPYYEHGGITIYHGDCREVLPELTSESVDLVLTDPPYGVNFKYASHDDSGGHEYTQFVSDVFVEMRRVGRVVMLTTGMLNLWLYPPATWVMCWAKPGSPRRSGLGGFNEWEPVLVYGKRRIYNDFKRLPAWNNTAKGMAGDHPCPKPLSLYLWLVGQGSDHGALRGQTTCSGSPSTGATSLTTVACVFVRGHVPFTVEYVVRLAAMVRRWMDRPYRFVCLTDHPEIIPSHIETITIPSPGALKGWWSKIELFNPRHELTGRVLYLDLDTLIVGPLAPVIDYPAPFALAPHAGMFNGKDGLAVVKRFNSSVMVFDAGTLDRLYETWTPDVAKRLHGDQDWIGEQVPGASPMRLEWFPRLSELGGSPPNADAKVVLAKRPKNIDAARIFTWVREVWQ